MTLDTSLLQRAIPDGSMRYFAWLYTPKQHRDAIAALFLLESELRDTARAPHDVAHIRLQWWREEIDRLNKGNAQHPATRVLQESRCSSTDFSSLDGFVVSTAQDIAHSTYESEAELHQYISSYGSLLQVAASFLDSSTSPQMSDAANQLGAFVRTVETLRDLRTDIHHGLLYLPLSEMDKLNIEYEQLASKGWPPEFNQWLKQRCVGLLKQQAQLRQRLRGEEASSLRSLWVLAGLHEKLLMLLINDSANFHQRLELGTLTKVWTAWRCAKQV